MNNTSSSYDSDLQMPRLDPKLVPVQMKHLNFYRWLGEHGRLEHPIASLPRGEYAFRYQEPLTNREVVR